MTAEAGRHVKAMIENVGIDVAIGYGVFLFVAVFVSVISTAGFIDIKVTLADLLGGDMARAAVADGERKRNLPRPSRHRDDCGSVLLEAQARVARIRGPAPGHRLRVLASL